MSHIGSSSIQTEIFNIYILDFYHKAMDLGGEKTGVNNMHDEWGEKERNAQCITGSSPVCKLYQKEKLALLYINHVITSDCHEYIVSYLVQDFFKGNNFDLIPSIHRPGFFLNYHNRNYKISRVTNRNISELPDCITNPLQSKRHVSYNKPCRWLKKKKQKKNWSYPQISKASIAD